MNIKTILKSSVAAAALVAIAAPAANAGIKNSNKNTLTVGGYVSKSLAYIDDGNNDHLFITDGATSESRVRWIASGKLNENVTAGAGIEMEIPLSGNSQAITVTASPVGSAGPSAGADRSDWAIRHQFVWVSHKKFGKLSLGNTNAAGNGSAEARLSGTGGLDNTTGRPFGGAVNFLDTSVSGAPSSSGVTVGAALSNFDMTSRTDVIRYDTPKFAGLKLAASLNTAGSGEVAGVYSGKFGGVKVLAKAAYANLAGSTSNDAIWAISAAAIHDSGINVAASYSTREQDSAVTTNDPDHVSFNVGYRAKIFGTGGTDFNFQFAQTEDLTAEGDQATSLGFTVMQNFSAIGTQVYLNWTNIEYETSTFSNYDDVNTIALNTVFNF